MLWSAHMPSRRCAPVRAKGSINGGLQLTRSTLHAAERARLWGLHLERLHLLCMGVVCVSGRHMHVI